VNVLEKDKSLKNSPRGGSKRAFHRHESATEVTHERGTEKESREDGTRHSHQDGASKRKLLPVLSKSIFSIRTNIAGKYKTNSVDD
jgi:hypothetical protein